LYDTAEEVSTFLVSKDFAMSAILKTLIFLEVDVFCSFVRGSGGDCDMDLCMTATWFSIVFLADVLLFSCFIFHGGATVEGVVDLVPINWNSKVSQYIAWSIMNRIPIQCMSDDFFADANEFFNRPSEGWSKVIVIGL